MMDHDTGQEKPTDDSTDTESVDDLERVDLDAAVFDTFIPPATGEIEVSTYRDAVGVYVHAGQNKVKMYLEADDAEELGEQIVRAAHESRDHAEESTDD